MSLRQHFHNTSSAHAYSNPTLDFFACSTLDCKQTGVAGNLEIQGIFQKKKKACLSEVHVGASTLFWYFTASEDSFPS